MAERAPWLLWVYYSSLILFFGAAFTKAKALASGKGWCRARWPSG